MSTGIQWTDETWNPVTGCTKVSPGCAHCYAEDVATRFWKGRPFTDVKFHQERLEQPLHWKRPRRVFVNSMSDLFHEALNDDELGSIFGVMQETPQHTYQVLTKRPERMRQFMLKYYAPASVRNVWIGVSVENQRMADERIQILIDTPAAVRFLSVEPLLEKVDLTVYLKGHGDLQRSPIQWVIVGGESGQQARPCNIEWIEHVVVQCEYYNVPCFVKQLGAKPVETGDKDDPWLDMESTDGTRMLGLRSAKGGDIEEWPEHLRVRQFPNDQVYA